MTAAVRMTTDEALTLLDEVRTTRRPVVVRDDVEWRDAGARVAILLDAARTASDDTRIGDPHQVVADLASSTLTKREVMRWFSTLIEAVAELDHLAAWKRRTHDQHHTDSAALDCAIATQADRAALAVAVLLDGEPDLDGRAA